MNDLKSNVDGNGYFIDLLQRGIRVHFTARLLHFLSEAPVEVRPNVFADVWVGTRAFIKNGVSIGTGAIVGAHSVVTKSIPPICNRWRKPIESHSLSFPV